MHIINDNQKNITGFGRYKGCSGKFGEKVCGPRDSGVQNNSVDWS